MPKIYLGPTKEPPKPAEQQPSGRKCMVPGCPKTVIYARDLCRPCYHYAANLVRKKVTTWEELEDKGLVHYATRPKGYPRRDWRAEHFKEVAPESTQFAKRADQPEKPSTPIEQSDGGVAAPIPEDQGESQ